MNFKTGLSYDVLEGGRAEECRLRRRLDGATRWLLARGQPGNVDDGVRKVLDSRSLSDGNQSMENG